MGKPVVHFEIGCTDLETVTGFYCKLFGWSSSEYISTSRRISTGSDRGIQGFINSLGHEPRNYTMIYVEVEDVEACTRKAEELGGKIFVPATKIPGRGEFAWVADPEGTMFGLWRPAHED